MKVSHVEGVASRNGLKSCGATREDGVEALTEEHAGWVLSRGTSRKRKEADVFSGRQTHRGKSQKPRSLDRGAAAMLVGTLAGERPVSGTCPVATVVISGGGAGDQSVESPDVNVLVGWGRPQSAPTGEQANRQVVA